MNSDRGQWDRARPTRALALVLSILGGCGANPVDGSTAGPHSDGGGGGDANIAPMGDAGSDASIAPMGDAGSDAGVDAASPCSAASQLVYVLSKDNNLYSFQPAMKQFTLIGSLLCMAPSGGLPNSMAVDRDATAWVNYVASDFLGDSGGWIYRVSTQDASCEAAPSFTLTDAPWYRLGMAFSANMPGGTSETLYGTGSGTQGLPNAPGLGKLDITTRNVSPIGQFSGDQTLSGQSGELSGTGDGKLFGFFVTTPVRVAEIEKATGKILSDVPIPGLATPQAWAFAAWGGALYLFTSDGTSNSSVSRFDPKTMTMDAAYTFTAPAIIVGAGASTCAPLTN